MLERRKTRRWRLNELLVAHSQLDHSPIGHIVDMTTEGMLLVSPIQYSRHETYRFWYQNPHLGTIRKRVEFTACCLWSKSVGEDYENGFAFHSVHNRTTLEFARTIEMLTVRSKVA